MSDTRDRAEKELPVTAEVGGEGGSYADSTLQAETFGGNERVEQKAISGPDGNKAAAAAEGEQVRESGELVKHASEPADKR